MELIDNKSKLLGDDLKREIKKDANELGKTIVGKINYVVASKSVFSYSNIFPKILASFKRKAYLCNGILILGGNLYGRAKR